MQKTTLTTLAVLLALSLAMVGCGRILLRGYEQGDLKVGMVSDVGGLNDSGFNENTWAGLQKADSELTVYAQFLESQVQTDYEKNITEFAEQDYDLIITVGPLLLEPTAELASQYPDTQFAIMDVAYETPIPNVQSITFSLDEAAFPAGYLAAAWADLRDPDDPQIGYVGDVQSLQKEQLVAAYRAGAEYYNAMHDKSVQIKGGSVSDVETAEQARIQGNLLIDEGVDVIFGVDGETGHGGLAAAKERGKWGIGVDVDQYSTLSNEKDVLITSCMKHWDNAVYAVVEATTKGRFGGGETFVGTLANGGVGLAPFHDFESEIPDNLRQDLEDVKQGIIDGTIDTSG